MLHVLASGLWSAVNFSTSKDTSGGLDLIRPEAWWWVRTVSPFTLTTRSPSVRQTMSNTNKQFLQLRPPLHKGHLYTRTTSTQGTPLHKGHLYTRDTSTQGTPLHKGHLYTRDTSTQGTPLHKGHLYTRDTSTQGHLYTGTPLHKDHLYTRDTSTQGPPLHKDHLYTRTTCTQGPPLHKDCMSEDIFPNPLVGLYTRHPIMNITMDTTEASIHLSPIVRRYQLFRLCVCA